MDYVFPGLLYLAALALEPIAFFANLGHGRRLRETEGALRSAAKRFEEPSAAVHDVRALLDQVAARLAALETGSTVPAEAAPTPPLAVVATSSDVVTEAPIPTAAPV
jgi:hypothetical protein